jgi:hypothetical protein
MKPAVLLFCFFAAAPLSAQHSSYSGSTCQGFYRFLISKQHCGITDSYLHYDIRASLNRRWFRGWWPCFENCWEADVTVGIRLALNSSVVLWPAGNRICPQWYGRYLARVRAHEARHRQADEQVFQGMEHAFAFSVTEAPSEEALRKMIQERLDQEKRRFGDQFNRLGRPLHKKIDRERCNDFIRCGQCK